jgi:ankyrin repeat protein
MEKKEPYLLCSLDEAARSPLFYAAANDQLEVVRYLSELWPESALYSDMHGDTPLHAASSAGSAQCLDHLSALSQQHAENNMGMTAVHMAQNVDCLAILFSAGYDFKVLDYSGRTPLFISCALNRIDCAQYLLDCLENPEACLSLQDSRGDAPLHAAACNGSVDCLLLLLQYGIDPDVKNNKGLTAIDLAVKKKQKQCVKMLAEYTLHFRTSSDFDSMFFIAAVEVCDICIPELVMTLVTDCSNRDISASRI